VGSFDDRPPGLLWADVGQDVHGADLAEKVNDLAFVLSGQRPLISDPDAAGAAAGGAHRADARRWRLHTRVEATHQRIYRRSSSV
jgi:hypothetical protein